MTAFIIIVSGWVLVIIDTWYYEWKKAKRIQYGNEKINQALYDNDVTNNGSDNNSVERDAA